MTMPTREWSEANPPTEAELDELTRTSEEQLTRQLACLAAGQDIFRYLLSMMKSAWLDGLRREDKLVELDFSRKAFEPFCTKADLLDLPDECYQRLGEELFDSLETFGGFFPCVAFELAHIIAHGLDVRDGKATLH
jgi:hypothetical protein